jgi:pyruvate formate lyase activating enzyme
MKEIEKDAAFYRNSRGGVTFGGGEPLFYPDFVGPQIT